MTKRQKEQQSPLADLVLIQFLIANAPGFASRDGKETC